MGEGQLDIDDPDLVAAIEALTAKEIDLLPFGSIRLDAHGIVTLYSARERDQSGYRGAAIGQHFFAEMAPCMNTPAFRGRLDAARKARRLDIRFDHVSDLPSGERDVPLMVRLVSASDGGVWILLQRDD